MSGVKSHKGYLVGKRMDAADIAEILWDAGWQDIDLLITALAVCLSECNGYPRARCENYLDGVLVSIDFGLFELNYPVAQIDDVLRAKLYDPRKNVEMAYQLWRRRGFQPWHGYTSGIALDPSARGKYVQRATWGVMNFTRRRFGMKGVPSPYITGGPRRLTWWLEHPEQKS